MTGAPAARAEGPRGSTVPLAIVSLLVAVPMLLMGAATGIDYDGWWHVFIARQDLWVEFWRDVYRNAHPPLFYLLLRAVSHLGTERLVYRSLSIVAAVIATYLVGRIAMRTLRLRPLSIVCALAFGLALPTAAIACSVRSYMLSTALLLLAFLHYLDLIDSSRRQVAPRTRCVFTLAMIGAVVSHYAAAFLLAAALAVPALYAAVDRGYRHWLGDRLRTHWRADLATVLPIVTVVVAAYALHMSRYSEPMWHTSAFTPSGNDWAAGRVQGGAAFLARALVLEVDLFSALRIGPLPIATRAAFILLGAGLALFLGLRLRRRSDWVVALAPLAVAIVIGGSIAAAALAGRYPFGGFLRHQFILFPFLAVSTFALVEEIGRGWPPRRLVAVACTAVLLNAGAKWTLTSFFDIDPWSDEMARFDRLFPDPAAVYVDGFSLIFLYAAHQRAAWATQTALEPDIMAISVRDPQRSFLVLRDLARRRVDVLDPRLYRDLRQLLQQTGVPAIDLFRVREDPSLLSRPKRTARADLTDAIIRTAASSGLRVERLAIDGSAVYARVVAAD